VTVQNAQLPALSRLLGPEAEGFAQQVVQSLGDGQLLYLKPDRASYRADWRFTVAYSAQVAWPDGRIEDETIVITARLDALPEGVVQIAGLGCEAGGWVLPGDPKLPGLAAATDIKFLRRLLDELEIGAHRISIQTVSYSPTTHAVIEVTVPPPARKVIYRRDHGFRFPDPPAVLYLKAMRPENGDTIRITHDRLHGVVPVARCIKWMPELGLLALSPLQGRTLWDCLLEGPYEPPSGEELIELLERMRDVELPSRGPETADQIAHSSAEILKSLQPSEAGRFEAVLAWLGEPQAQPRITIHGDFHEAQLLLGDRGVSGMLDLDDAGPGERADDLAMMVGRLWSFAPSAPSSDRIEHYADELFESFSRTVDPRELYRRAVAVAFARATNPFRYQDPDWEAETLKVLEVAEQKIAQAP